MGLSYEQLKEWDKAIEAYEKSIEFAPEFPASHLHLGKLYLQLNRLEEAEKELFKAMETDRAGTYAMEAKRLLDEMPAVKEPK
jgi:tetratricopeptide (TPR) repeat protein